MTPVPELNDLVDTVGDRCPTGTELDKLRAASDVAREVGRVGEDLVTHFVSEARNAGASWADIGDVLGVSRQGAHQRHNDRPRPDRWWQADLGRLTPRTREAIKSAIEQAHTVGNPFVGTEHLLLGVLAIEGNVGLEALRRCGVDVDALRTATTERLLPAGEVPADAGPSWTRGDGDWRGGRGRGRGRGRGPWDPPERPASETVTADEAPGGRGPRRGPGGRGGRSGWRMPFTQSARRTFDLATGAALDLGHNYLGCEHMVIALAAGDGVAAEVIAATGTSPDALAEAVAAILADRHPTA